MKVAFLFVLLMSVVSFTRNSHAQNNLIKEPTKKTIEEKEYIVEDTPIEIFSERSRGWNFYNLNESQTSYSSSIYESLQKIPGVYTQGETAGGNPSIRIRAANSVSRNLILLDGAPLNTQDGLGPNPMLLPMELISNVDVLKGPASTFYGSSAVGGAINLKTKKFERPTVRLGYETYNWDFNKSERPSLLLASPLFKNENHFQQGSVFLESSRGNFEYDDSNLGKNTERSDNQFNRQRYSLSGENKISKTTFFHQFLYAKENGSSPGPVPFSENNVTLYNREAFLGSLSAKRKLLPDLQAQLKTTYLQTDNKNTDSFSGATDYFVSKSVNTLSFDYVYNDHNFEFLTDYYYDHFENNPTVTSKHEGHLEHAVFYSSQITQTEFFSAGIRFFPDQNEFVKNLLVKQDRGDFILWASYSEGLKTPSFTERFADTAFYKGNPGLDVEKSDQIEVGVEKSVGFVKSSLSAYTIEYKNFIQYISVPAPYSYENLQKVEGQGFDWNNTFDYKIFHGQLSYSFLKAEDSDSNEQILFVPRHQVYTLLGAQLSVLVFEVHNTHWASYKTSSTKKEPQWNATDFTVRTNGLSDWSIRAGVKNIFNNSKSLTEGYPEPGRSFFTFVERSF